ETEVFQSQGEQFTQKNKHALSNILEPVKEQIGSFRERVEQVHSNDTKDRASLLTELKNLQSASEKINLEASNLTRALKGDKKVQGNWGELVLETVLSESGLRSGHEYTKQMSLRNESGDLKRPDIVIHLPDDKDIVVDSKVSLVAYEKALSAQDDDSRKKHVAQHVKHVKEQVSRLADQNYEQLKGVKSLDFVLLFLPIEPAFILAMEEDPALFREAFSKRIMIVSPTTLMMTLRIIDNIWRYEKQNQNAQEIASRAGAIYDKLRGTIDDMETLGRAIKAAEKAFDTANTKLSTGKGNLVKRVEKFRELGATPKKRFSRTVLENAKVDRDS
ncbi:MAG: DNA recombination protein RmuC, partial [Pseudomonadales bacterium]|nr:DNA recombination protein RmuC [Pseudomonadales bacterium]